MRDLTAGVDAGGGGNELPAAAARAGELVGPRWCGTALVLRPEGPPTPSVVDYKSSERAKIAAKGFTIIANVGDQPSDLAGGYAERTFLVSNPFYRIP